MENISKLDFNRKFLIKKIRKSFEKYFISCKIFKTTNKDIIQSNFKKIVKKLNLAFMSDKLFDNQQLIKIYLTEIETYFEFLKEYETTIQQVESQSIIQQSSDRFLSIQNNFIAKLDKEFNPFQCLIKPHI